MQKIRTEQFWNSAISYSLYFQMDKKGAMLYAQIPTFGLPKCIYRNQLLNKYRKQNFTCSYIKSPTRGALCIKFLFIFCFFVSYSCDNRLQQVCLRFYYTTIQHLSHKLFFRVSATFSISSSVKYGWIGRQSTRLHSSSVTGQSASAL